MKTFIVQQLILIILFFGLYAMSYYNNKTSFKGVNNMIDIFYYTTSIQSSTGCADVYPSSNKTKLITSAHNILTISTFAHFVYRLLL